MINKWSYVPQLTLITIKIPRADRDDISKKQKSKSAQNVENDCFTDCLQSQQTAWQRLPEFEIC